MLNIFYRQNGKIALSQSEKDFAKIKLEDTVWIDLVDPSGSEKRVVESFLGTEIQSRAQAEEIESSSRYFETDDAIFANTNFLTPGAEEYSMQAVSFTLVDDTLTTLREVPLRSFTELQRRLQVNPRQYPSGFTVFATILDQRVDLDADMIELLSKEISQYAKRINEEEDIDQELLIDISQLQENTMMVRENVVDKQRLISNLMRSNKVPTSLEPRLNVLLQDISSLLNHTNFCFERLEYLQDTVLGLINLEQNKIMKIFTVVSVFLMPPTLIAGFYGMNVRLPMIAADEPNASFWNWIIILGIMVLSCLAIWFVFRKKKML
ncbi:MAG: magnesium and cobalt transport protein CorA [Bacteroidales bacterium]|nr:magnesium and cobalt transport protein CorA [Bacteroidales bacterium]MBR2747662.1 magnesium and cobalt transport protein CorA [Bacteroidales bacterium]MBR3097448.1 magnesium and cobalt transport protein CorA [Bacteroidales bacterium]MBR4686936.1 magnesium and cobalt transport protein CorA [Bacteroidales bacterium]